MAASRSVCLALSLHGSAPINFEAAGEGTTPRWQARRLHIERPTKPSRDLAVQNRYCIGGPRPVLLPVYGRLHREKPRIIPGVLDVRTGFLAGEAHRLADVSFASMAGGDVRLPSIGAGSASPTRFVSIHAR